MRRVALLLRAVAPPREHIHLQRLRSTHYLNGLIGRSKFDRTTYRARTVTLRTRASILRVLHLFRVRLQDFCKRKIFRHSVAEAVHLEEEHLRPMVYGVFLE